MRQAPLSASFTPPTSVSTSHIGKVQHVGGKNKIIWAYRFAGLKSCLNPLKKTNAPFFQKSLLSPNRSPAHHQLALPCQFSKCAICSKPHYQFSVLSSLSEHSCQIVQLLQTQQLQGLTPHTLTRYFSTFLHLHPELGRNFFTRSKNCNGDFFAMGRLRRISAQLQIREKIAFLLLLFELRHKVTKLRICKSGSTSFTHAHYWGSQFSCLHIMHFAYSPL